MKIIGVDPGTRITGYGIVIADGGASPTSPCWGAITTTSGATMPLRLRQIADGLRQVIKKHQPDTMALEESFVAKNPNTALKLGQARGVIMLIAEEAGLDFAEYAPLKIKQTVVGVGRAEKSQVQMMVRHILSLKETPEPLDASDALAVAITHLAHHETAARLEKAR